VNDLFGDTEQPVLESRVLREQLETLGNQLVWKIGKDEISERIIVRVGYANATQSFRDLPKLRGATDPEIAAAAKDGELTVEWIE
jgi:predicted acyl esterase